MTDLAFVLLLTIWQPDAPPNVYVLDYNLTGEDCIAALVESLPEPENATLSCELDNAMID